MLLLDIRREENIEKYMEKQVTVVALIYREAGCKISLLFQYL